MSTDYLACVKQTFEMTNQITEKRASWQQRILFLCATLFGILISLHTDTQSNLCSHLCFAAACVLLSLGTLLLSIASYHHIVVQTQARNRYAEEVQNAIEEGRPVGPVRADKIKFFGTVEAISYICLLFSMLLLATYSVLKSVDNWA